MEAAGWMNCVNIFELSLRGASFVAKVYIRSLRQTCVHAKSSVLLMDEEVQYSPGLE